jgi:hypothetical protein
LENSASADDTVHSLDQLEPRFLIEESAIVSRQSSTSSSTALNPAAMTGYNYTDDYSKYIFVSPIKSKDSSTEIIVSDPRLSYPTPPITVIQTASNFFPHAFIPFNSISSSSDQSSIANPDSPLPSYSDSTHNDISSRTRSRHPLNAQTLRDVINPTTHSALFSTVSSPQTPQNIAEIESYPEHEKNLWLEAINSEVTSLTSRNR